MKYRLTTGLDVRTGDDEVEVDEHGNQRVVVPTRRIGEVGDVISISNVPEWNGSIPQWLLDDGLLVPEEEETRDDKPEANELTVHDEEVS